MGSYPQIADKRGTHDLYGPVNRMMCAGYDRAMVMFLTCVKVGACAVVSRMTLRYDCWILFEILVGTLVA